MEALASHGFVVAAPDHPGDTMLDAASGRQASLLALAADRLHDVSAVIDVTEAHRLTVRYTVAFLARRLRNETGYDRYLGPPADRPASAVTVRRAM